MIEIRETEADQPWHVVVVSDNNYKDLLVGENLANIEDAFNQIRAAAFVFGIVGLSFERIHLDKNENYVMIDIHGRTWGAVKVVKLDAAAQA